MRSHRHTVARLAVVVRSVFHVLLVAITLSLASSRAEDAAVTGRTFTSPEDAVKALSIAVNNRDTNALADIFGPEFKNIRAADPIQGQNELAAFAARFNESHQLLYVNETNCILETGADQWPFPVPIVRKGGVWFFDTAAGEDELLNRRIGRNELDALKAIRAGAEAQREFAVADHDNDGVREFAQKFISSPGKKDGLYWSPDIDGEISPLGPAFVAAQNEGYFQNPQAGQTPQPFRGYYFKMLTRQGKHTPVGAYNYIINGHMIGGFAFVAWPAQYGNSGIMTFIINQDGKVYQKDLGPKTASIVKKMKEFDPDSSWTLSLD